MDKQTLSMEKWFIEAKFVDNLLKGLSAAKNKYLKIHSFTVAT